MDPWDNLLRVIGRGWPYYKDAAMPIIGNRKESSSGTYSQTSSQINNNNQCNNQNSQRISLKQRLKIRKK